MSKGNYYHIFILYLIMAYMSFANVKCAFTIGADTQAFRCVGVNCNVRCVSDLIDVRKDKAQALLQRDAIDLQEIERLDIIVFLLCAKCQVRYTCRTAIKKQWHQETGISFGRKGLSTPNSLHPSRSKKSTSGFRNRARRQNTSCAHAATRAMDPHDHEITPRLPEEGPMTRSCRTTELEYLARLVDELRIESQPVALETHGLGEYPTLPNSTVSDHQSQGPNHTPQPLCAETVQTMSCLFDTRYFRRGKGWEMAPWRLRLNLVARLLEPLPSDTGFVYVVQVQGTRLVKIGKTIASAQRLPTTRISGVRNQHKTQIDESSARWSLRLPHSHVDRLEKVVHDCLAYFQVDLVDKQSEQPVHGEYFEVDLDTAEQCIKLGYRLMQSVGLESGHYIDQDIQDIIRESIDGIDKPPEGVDIQDREWWRTVNSNPQRQFKILNEAFKCHLGGFQRIKQVEKVFWYIGIVVSLLVAFLLPLPPVVSSCVAFYLIRSLCACMSDTKYWLPLLY